jgi:hypothetical protein
MLSEYFTQEADGWHQKRCDEEIARYHEKSESARRSINARWHKRNTNEDTNVIRTNDERNTNQNQEPRTKPPIPPAAPRLDLPPGFVRFWAAYPRKQGKGAALKAWQKARPDDLLTERILRAVAAARCSPQWARDGGQFIPHPSTWLNEGRWDDEPVGSDAVLRKVAL